MRVSKSLTDELPSIPSSSIAIIGVTLTIFPVSILSRVTASNSETPLLLTIEEAEFALKRFGVSAKETPPGLKARKRIWSF